MMSYTSFNSYRFISVQISGERLLALVEGIQEMSRLEGSIFTLRLPIQEKP